MPIPMRYDTWMAIASLALHVMFVIYINSLYMALTRPLAIGATIAQPWNMMIIGMFLFGIPGFGLAGVAYLLAKGLARKSEVRRAPSMIIIAQGAILLLGMINASSIEKVMNDYYVEALTNRGEMYLFSIIPQLFMVGSIPLMGVGAYLYTIKPKQQRFKSNL